MPVISLAEKLTEPDQGVYGSGAADKGDEPAHFRGLAASLWSASLSDVLDEEMMFDNVPV